MGIADPIEYEVIDNDNISNNKESIIDLIDNNSSNSTSNFTENNTEINNNDNLTLRFLKANLNEEEEIN